MPKELGTSEASVFVRVSPRGNFKKLLRDRYFSSQRILKRAFSPVAMNPRALYGDQRYAVVDGDLPSPSELNLGHANFMLSGDANFSGYSHSAPISPNFGITSSAPESSQILHSTLSSSSFFPQEQFRLDHKTNITPNPLLSPSQQYSNLFLTSEFERASLASLISPPYFRTPPLLFPFAKLDHSFPCFKPSLCVADTQPQQNRQAFEFPPYELLHRDDRSDKAFEETNNRPPCRYSSTHEQNKTEKSLPLNNDWSPTIVHNNERAEMRTSQPSPNDPARVSPDCKGNFNDNLNSTTAKIEIRSPDTECLVRPILSFVATPPITTPCEAKHAKRGRRLQSTDTSLISAYVCSICSRKFARSDMLVRHMHVHTGHRPFECQACGHSFSRSDHLSTHLRTHTGHRPYRCSWCPYSACRRDMITRHLRVHQIKGQPIENGSFDFANGLPIRNSARVLYDPFSHVIPSYRNKKSGSGVKLKQIVKLSEL